MCYQQKYVVTQGSIELLALAWREIYWVAENLGLWARSETVGYAICPSSLWFQVSGFRCQKKTNPEF